MGAWLDWLAIRLGVGTILALALSATLALLMIGQRQPARRVFLARAALVGVLVLAAGVAWRGDALSSRLGATLRERTGLPAAEIPPDARRAVAAAGLGGWLVAAGWLALGRVALRQVSRRARPAGEAARAQLRALVGPTGSGVRILFSPDLARPIAAGAFRPRLILPSAFAAEAHRDELRLALAHEVAHCRRGDLLFSGLGQLASAVWFFLPTVRWIERQMRRDQEFLADRDAAEWLGRGPLPYAATLLNLAGGGASASPGVAASAAPPMAGLRMAGGGLTARLAMLLQSPFRVETKAPAWYRVTFAGACGLGALLAGLLAGPSGSPASPAPAAGPSRFVARSLQLQGTGPDGPGAAVATSVPVRLPPAFDLRLEVDTALLERLDAELAGCRIIAAPSGPGEESGLHRWTSVRLRRRAGRDEAWIDGRPVAVARGAGPAPTTLSLHFRGVSAVAVRNLVLEW